MKKFTLHSFVILVIVIAILFNIFWAVILQRGQNRAEMELSPFTGASDNQGHIYSVDFFESQTRPIRLIPHVYSTRMHDRCLFESLIDLYKDQEDNLLEGEILESLEVISIYEASSSIYLNLSSGTFRSWKLTPENIYYYIMSVVNTITEDHRDYAVHILIDGELPRDPIYGQSFSQPFYRDERIVEINNDYLFFFLEKVQSALSSGDIAKAKSFFTFDQEEVSDQRFTEEVNDILAAYPLETANSSTFMITEGYRRLYTYYLRNGVEDYFAWNFKLRNNVLYIDYNRSISDVLD